MNLIKEKWTKEDYYEFSKYLLTLTDDKFKDFSTKIIVDDSLIGIRTPILKNIAKIIFKGNYKEFISVCKPSNYEEKLIYGLVIGNIKEFNKETIKYVNKYSKTIDNWALCDLFCANLKFVKNNQKEVFDYILNTIDNDNLWKRRLCFVLLLDYYIEPDYIDVIFELCDTYNTNDYYVEMSVAWLISICYIKEKDKTIKYLDSNKLNNFTYNKAIQKIIESKRVAKEEKEELRKKKRRNI